MLVRVYITVKDIRKEQATEKKEVELAAYWEGGRNSVDTWERVKLGVVT